MFKKALIAASAVALSAAPSFAGSLGTLTGTSSTTITGGSRNYSITGTYASEEHTVGAGATASGTTATATWSTAAGPTATVTAVGPNAGGTTQGTASYGTNAVTAGSYTDTVSSSFTGTESGTSTGVFFNY